MLSWVLKNPVKTTMPYGVQNHILVIPAVVWMSHQRLSKQVTTVSLVEKIWFVILTEEHAIYPWQRQSEYRLFQMTMQ